MIDKFDEVIINIVNDLIVEILYCKKIIFKKKNIKVNFKKTK